MKPINKCNQIKEPILLVVDGSNLLFQMFFGMPTRIIGKNGKAIHRTLGFIGALIKIIKMTEPTHITVLFDSEQENERTEISVDYKANRPSFTDVPDHDNPFSQLDDIYTALDHMGIKHTEIRGYETDDAVASYVYKYGSNIQIVISSFDSDFFQLIRDNVSILRYRGQKTIICDSTFLYDKYGITPEQYADFKSLTGDSSDNIKGAPKIGPKTAAVLLRQFGNLQNIIEKADEIEKPSIRQSIKQNSERLINNQILIKLDNSAPIPFELSEIEYYHQDIKTNEVLKAIGLR